MLLLRLLRCIATVLLVLLMRSQATVLLVLLIWSRTIVLLVGRCSLLSVLSLGIRLRQRVVLLVWIVLLGRHDVLLVRRVLALCHCCWHCTSPASQGDGALGLHGLAIWLRL